jgi:ketosteroid isomerase-like protein
MTSLEQRIRRLEDLEEIRSLAIRYGFAVDDRDLDRIRELFSDDAELRTMSGPSKGKGIDAVVEYFRSTHAVLGPTNHFTHGHVVEFDENDPDRATGIVAAHAEVVRNGVPMITAMRYYDTYVRTPAGWRFRERVQSYMYFVDVREYAEALGHELRMRRAPDDWKPADWPVITPTRS